MNDTLNIQIPFVIYIEYQNNFKYDSYFTNFNFVKIQCLDAKIILYQNGIVNIFSNSYIYQFESNFKKIKIIIDKNNFYFYNYNLNSFISPINAPNWQLANFINYEINQEVNKIIDFKITPIILNVN